MVTPEMVPFAKTGGLADVAGALPLELAELGQRVSVILPCYRGVEQKYQPEDTGVEVVVPILHGDHWIDKRGRILKTTQDKKADVYLVKMDEYYDRDALYALPERDYTDNCARFTFFCRAVMDFLKAKDWRPDLIHSHDWQSALVPIYLNTVYREDPLLSGVPAVFTIHNLAYQGLFWMWDMKLIGVPWDYFTSEYLEYYGKLNLLKGGIVFSDIITTVSRGYAREIQTVEHGLGLDGVLRDRDRDLYGIVNGIDYNIWSPENDNHIPANYSADDLSGKARCKKELQEEMRLAESARTPLLACISRLADQKGFDLLTAVIDEFLEGDIQFVLLGTGDIKYQKIFKDISFRYPDKTGINITYDEALAHRIEAGADIFVMPSLYEPCGLNQLISLRYGTVPAVRATGGLDDTIREWDPETGEGNGFKFGNYNERDFLECLQRALAFYSRREEWQEIMRSGMREDYSWSASAKEYLWLYNKLTGE
ncbi:MAG: glycogen synthase GlgA [bacterium]